MDTGANPDDGGGGWDDNAGDVDPQTSDLSRDVLAGYEGGAKLDADLNHYLTRADTIRLYAAAHPYNIPAVADRLYKLGSIRADNPGVTTGEANVLVQLAEGKNSLSGLTEGMVRLDRYHNRI